MHSAKNLRGSLFWLATWIATMAERIHHPLEHKSSMRRGTYFGSFGGQQPHETNDGEVERERERAKVQQMEQLEDHYNNRLRLMQKGGNCPTISSQGALEMWSVDDRLDARLQLELGRGGS